MSYKCWYRVQRNETKAKLGDCKIRTNELWGPTQSRSQFKNMFLLLLSFGRYPAMLLKFFFLYKRKGRKRRTKTKKFWHIFPPNFLVSEHLRGSQNVRRELRGECLRQQNGWKALLLLKHSVYSIWSFYLFQIQVNRYM